MPFKLTKDHIGKKVRRDVWDPGEWILLEWLRDNAAAGVEESGGLFFDEYVGDEEWELYEEPKPQVWWEEGKTYKHKANNKCFRFRQTGDGKVLVVYSPSYNPTGAEDFSAYIADAEQIKQEDFEEVADPAPKVWWEDGKTYRRKSDGYRFMINKPIGDYAVYNVANAEGTTLSNSLKAPVDSFKEEDFEEYIPPKKPKTIRMAPALVKIESRFCITDFLFETAEKAKEVWQDYFTQWPASDNLWVEVPVEEESK